MTGIAQRRVAGATALMILLYLLQVMMFTPTAEAAPPEKITICHAAGLADQPANWQELTLPPSAVYGNGGHFHENGTPQAGHENDYLGPCESDEDHEEQEEHEDHDVPSLEFTVGSCDVEGTRALTFAVADGFEVSINDADNVLVGFWVGPQAVSVDLAPGEYSWTYWELVGEDKVAIDQGQLTVPECQVTVSASGTCSDVDGVFATISIVVSESGASMVTVDGPNGYSDSGNTTGVLSNGPIGEYTWTAEPTGSYTIDGDDSGVFEVVDCGQTTRVTIPPPSTGSIVILKETTDPTGELFPFTINGTGFALGDGGSETFSNLLPGSYVVTEGAVDGWGVLDLSCVDPSGDSNWGNATASIQLAAGETVICTFVNSEAEVLGTTVTTVPEVSAETLPFTGFETGDTLTLGLLALLAGGLLLVAGRNPRRDTVEVPVMGEWSTS